MIDKSQRFWKVKFGHRSTEYVSVEEGGELEKAIYAMMTGTPTQLGYKFVKGTHIMSIEPNYHIHTGWNDFYEPTDGNDWEQIKRECPDYTGVLEKYKTKIIHLQNTNQLNLIGKNVDIPELNNPPKNKVYRALIKGSEKIADKFKIKQ